LVVNKKNFVSTLGPTVSGSMTWLELTLFLDANNFIWARVEKREALYLVGYFALGGNRSVCLVVCGTRNVRTPSLFSIKHTFYHIPLNIQHNIPHACSKLDNIQDGIKQSTTHNTSREFSLESWQGLDDGGGTLDHLSHGVVEDGDLEDVAPHHLERQEVADLDLVGNGKSKSPLIQADNALHIPQFHHLGAAGVRLEDDRPRDDAKVGAEACRDWQQFQPRRQHHLGKVGWSEVVMEMANLDRPPPRPLGRAGFSSCFVGDALTKRDVSSTHEQLGALQYEQTISMSTT
jgi:hypothetical protein